MFRLSLLGAATLALSSESAFAELENSHALARPGKPVMVEVTSEAKDMMARRLASAVIRELSRDSRLRLAEADERATLSISLPSSVGWERRLDWTEISYQARVSSRTGESRLVAGHCWNWNLAVCAKQITDAVAKFANN